MVRRCRLFAIKWEYSFQTVSDRIGSSRIQYDSSGKWEHKLHIKGKGLKTFLAPIIPRRCDHLKLKMIGKGEMRMYSLAKVYEQGSDVNDA